MLGAKEFSVPDVQVPHLEDEEETVPRLPLDADARQSPGKAMHRSKSLLKIGLEVVLIGAGVFLGLMGEQWRENVRHRELAQESLRRFRVELQTNRKAVTDVKDYHVTVQKRVAAYLAENDKARASDKMELKGIQPAFFEHTAWDLALATQSLANLDAPVAVALSRVYGVQQEYDRLSYQLTQAMYLRPPNQDLAGFLSALALYYGDITLLEPQLLRLYDDVLPQLDNALGDTLPRRVR